MGIRVEWDNPDQTTIREIFDPCWTWDDFYAAKSLVDRMIETAGHTVSVILDMPANVMMPPDALSHGKHYVDTAHPDLCLIVIACSNQLLQILYDLFGRVYPSTSQRVRMVRRVDDARELLLRVRRSVTMG